MSRRSTLVAVLTVLGTPAVPATAAAAGTARVEVEPADAGGPANVHVRPEFSALDQGQTVTVTISGGVARVQGTSTAVTAATGCSQVDTAQVTCAVPADATLSYTGTSARDAVELVGAARATYELGGGDDILLGGSGPDVVFGRGGGDTIETQGGSDLVYPGTGNDVVRTGDGDNDLVILGYDDASDPAAADGDDVVSDSGGSGDGVSFSGHTAGVFVRVADGNPGTESDGPPADRDEVQAGFERIQGTAQADVIFGSGAAETINGSDGDDQLTGGGGPDRLEGNGGLDSIDADDGVADELVACDAPSDPPAGNRVGEPAKLDALDPEPLSCEQVTRSTQIQPPTATTTTTTPPGTGTQPPGQTQGSPAGPSGPPAGVLEDTTRTFRMPAVAVKKKTRYKLLSVASLEAQIEASGARIKVKRQLVAFSGVPATLRDDVRDGDVVKASVAEGKVLTTTAVGPALTITVRVYDEAKELGLSTNRSCPYKNGDTRDFLKALERAAADRGVEALEKARCEWRVIRTDRGDVPFEQISSANVSRVKGASAKRPYAITVVIDRPRTQSDFAVTVLNRPRADGGTTARFADEPGLSADGRLPTTAGTDSNAVTVLVHNPATARTIAGLELELYDASGQLVASQQTGGTGARTLNAPFKTTGTARVVARLTDTSGRIAEGSASIRVADLSSGFFTLDGRYLKRAGSTFKKTTPPAPPAAVAAVLANVRAAVDDLAGRAPGWAAASGALAAASGANAGDQLQGLAAGLGLQASKTTAGGTLDATVNPAPVTGSAPGLIARADGSLVRMPAINAIGIPSAGDADMATLIGQDGGSLIGNDGGTLIGNDGSTLIGNDGGSLIGNDGSTLIGNDGGSLLATSALRASSAGIFSLGGVGLIGTDGGSLLPPGVRLISDPGAGILARDGAGIISRDGAGILARDGAGFTAGMALMPAIR